MPSCRLDLTCCLQISDGQKARQLEKLAHWPSMVASTPAYPPLLPAMFPASSNIYHTPSTAYPQTYTTSHFQNIGHFPHHHHHQMPTAINAPPPNVTAGKWDLYPPPPPPNTFWFRPDDGSIQPSTPPSDSVTTMTVSAIVFILIEKTSSSSMLTGD